MPARIPLPPLSGPRRSARRRRIAVAAVIAGLPVAAAPALATATSAGSSAHPSGPAARSASAAVTAALPGRLLVARDGDLYSVRANGTAWRRLAPKVTSAAWSPDGTRIAYSTYASGVPTIWVMSAAGGGKQRVTGGSAYDESPTWSPDGTRLAYHSCAADLSGCSVATIRSVAPFGTPKVLLTGGPKPTTGACAGASSDAYLDPSWHPTLDRLALQHACRYADKPSVVLPLIVSAKTGAVVTRVPGRLSNPDWTRDGRRLAWVDARDVEGATAIIRTGAAGQNPARITPWTGPGDFPNSADSPVWSPDGRWVAYAKAFSDTWVTTAAGTSRRLLFAGARPLDWR